MLDLHLFLVPLFDRILDLLNLFLAMFLAKDFHCFAFLFLSCSGPYFNVVHFFLLVDLEVLSFTTLHALVLRQDTFIVKFCSFFAFKVYNLVATNFRKAFLFKLLKNFLSSDLSLFMKLLAKPGLFLVYFINKALVCLFLCNLFFLLLVDSCLCIHLILPVYFEIDFDFINGAYAISHPLEFIIE